MVIVIFFFVVLIIVAALLSQGNRQTKSVEEEFEKIYYMSGLEFEHYCAELLKMNGYRSVDVTQGSGDYGADILARYDGARYAIQCKKYSQSVGIKAVQEIAAAKQYYSTDKAAVLTNTFFTKAAIRLARQTNVLLWDRRFLEKLIENRKPIATYSVTANEVKHDESRQEKQTSLAESAEVKKELTKAMAQPETYILGKNELPNGTYLIGKDIPVGVYDFNLLWGDGALYVSRDGTTKLGALLFDQRLGHILKTDKTFCLNVHCEEGHYLIVHGNIAVSIKRSKPIQLEL